MRQNAFRKLVTLETGYQLPIPELGFQENRDFSALHFYTYCKLVWGSIPNIGWDFDTSRLQYFIPQTHHTIYTAKII